MARTATIICTSLALLIVTAPARAGSPAGDKSPCEFEKTRLTDEYYSEGASYGDFDRDGDRDIVCGPYWFEGPAFTKKHQFYAGKAFPNDRGYSNNFFSFVDDFNGDGWDDVLVVGLPGTPASWYENSQGKDGMWNKHRAFPSVENESPRYEDITGDGKPELICGYERRVGYATPDPSDPTKEWQWHAITPEGKWHRYTHGLGVGDVNGDGRKDFLLAGGWWEQPASLAGDPVWKHHPHNFGGGGAQMYAYDVDGDGDGDVVTSIQAHGWGFSWYEQIAAPGGGITFREHRFMGSKLEDSPCGICFSQPHAVDVADVNGDRLPDIITGKCYWAHNGADPGAREPAVLVWFELTRKDGKAKFVGREIDNDSGVGRQVTGVDIDGDGRLDVLSGNKKGTFLFRQKER